ncbi:MAG: hypothetical protein J6C50_04480 [Rickettsiales bacterium]|nr:hypothetical protein [Rickettsiales bacterium]
MKLEYIVKNLIQNNKIRTQLELTNILYKKGFNTTQSNISRILKKLNTVKIVDEDNDTYYIIHNKPLDVSSKIKDLVLSIDTVNNMIVIKTYKNAASLINQIISERNIDGVVSTLYGDNSVLIVPENQEFMNKVGDKLKSLFLSEK